MKVYTLSPHGFASNTFAVTENGKDCVLIDCAQSGIYGRCVALGLTPRAVLLTHGHLDHIGGCGILAERGVDIYCGEGEESLIYSQGYRDIFPGEQIPVFDIRRALQDGETLSLCGLEIRVIATPGHTSGSVSYIIGNSLFSGDTLFYCGVGRWDFYSGSLSQLTSSIKKMYALKGDFTVYCGHGDNTSLSYERAYNPYVRGNTD